MIEIYAENKIFSFKNSEFESFEIDPANFVFSVKAGGKNYDFSQIFTYLYVGRIEFRLKRAGKLTGLGIIPGRPFAAEESAGYKKWAAALTYVADRVITFAEGG